MSEKEKQTINTQIKILAKINITKRIRKKKEFKIKISWNARAERKKRKSKKISAKQSIKAFVTRITIDGAWSKILFVVLSSESLKKRLFFSRALFHIENPHFLLFVYFLFSPDRSIFKCLSCLSNLFIVRNSLFPFVLLFNMRWIVFFVQVFGGKALCAPIHDMIFTSYFHSIFTRHNNNNNNNIGKQFQEQICAHLANQTEKWKEWERKVAIAQSTLTSWMRKCFSTEYNNHKRPSQKRKAIINIFAFPFWFRLHLVSVHYLFVWIRMCVCCVVGFDLCSLFLDFLLKSTFYLYFAFFEKAPIRQYTFTISIEMMQKTKI